MRSYSHWRGCKQSMLEALAASLAGCVRGDAEARPSSKVRFSYVCRDGAVVDE